MDRWCTCQPRSWHHFLSTNAQQGNVTRQAVTMGHFIPIVWAQLSSVTFASNATDSEDSFTHGFLSKGLRLGQICLVLHFALEKTRVTRSETQMVQRTASNKMI